MTFNGWEPASPTPGEKNDEPPTATTLPPKDPRNPNRHHRGDDGHKHIRTYCMKESDIVANPLQRLEKRTCLNNGASSP